MSLRLRLLLALVGLVAIGLLVADGVTYLSLQSFLLQRVDQQLEAAPLPMVRALEESASGSGLPGDVPTVPAGERAVLPAGTYGCLLDASGQILAQTAISYGGSTPPVPSLPTRLPQFAAKAGGQTTITASATGHSSLRFRVFATQRVVTTESGAVYTLVVAIPLTDVTQTLQRLLLVEAVATLAVLIGLGLLAWWIVRREMRPLEDMAATAGAIAAGDLSQRVERADSRTEVGRLGLALNAMLSQIEVAFTRSHNSENALRHFLAQASHELRTPLSSIRGYAELFRRGAKERPEDLDLAMRRIEQEAARMGVLVEDLLLLARLDEGRALDREPVDLTQLAADAVADARIVAPGRDLELVQNGSVVVLGDESRLRQVFTNLVVNALRHGGEQAHVRVATSAADGRAVIEVSDDGVGMTSEIAARAFEPFYRPQESRARGEGTAGLGLSIVAAIAEAHGGQVDLQTAPGQGARFRVSLPLATPSAGDDAPQGDWPSGVGAPQSSGTAAGAAAPDDAPPPPLLHGHGAGGETVD
jgi:two-component system, OmpR family, sensor kinase